MVLQRDVSSVVWGFGVVGTKITTQVGNKQTLSTTVGTDGIWRQKLPSMPATTTPTEILFSDGAGTTQTLHGVLFGDVYVCSGQSNMQYTPHSMAGMNNLTAELAAADAYSKTIKFFTVGMETACGTPPQRTDCSKPFLELAHGPNIRSNNSAPCRGGSSCREGWEPASSTTLGGTAWDHFSAVCFLTARDIHDALGGTVPLGLISTNWGGTPVQSWERNTGTLFNSMVAPFTVGPMALRGVTWYQGEMTADNSTLACSQLLTVTNHHHTHTYTRAHTRGSERGASFVLFQRLSGHDQRLEGRLRRLRPVVRVCANRGMGLLETVRPPAVRAGVSCMPALAGH